MILRHHDHTEGSGHAEGADKTRILLGYLYDHNVHHASELDDLAAKLTAEGRTDAAEKVLSARELFDQGNALLHEAIHAME